MRALVLLVIALFQVALGKPDKQVKGYVGGNVTLPSEVNRSWTLSKIEWSVFLNTTWIATYRNGKKNIDRLSQYSGRLQLNTSTGDLTIHNLTRADSMLYTLDLINTEKQSAVYKIQLTVIEHPKNPTIRTLFNAPANINGNNCLIVMHCTSQDQDVTFSWKAKPLNMAKLSSMGIPNGNPAAVFLNHGEAVSFTCTSNNTSDVTITEQCQPIYQPQSPYTPRCRHTLFFILGLVIGSVVVGIVICKYGENILPMLRTKN